MKPSRQHALLRILGSHALVFFLAMTSSIIHVSAQSNSKRGISTSGDSHRADWSLLTSSRSPLTWYWNWGPQPSSANLVANLEFIPQIHGIYNLAGDVARVKSLPSRSTHLMTFNEPDGTEASGGTSITPEDAAQAYITHILPLRKPAGGRFLVSHPATTGSSVGLDWLRRFNSSCYKINPSAGCPSDFITAHWYGDFQGLASWIGQLNQFYNGIASSTRPVDASEPLRLWLTEMALPQADERATIQMMNQTLSYLDGLDFVSGYAWFGMFRMNESNQWTGPAVALFSNDGALTNLGATYLNGVVGQMGNLTQTASGASASGTGGFRPGEKGGSVAIFSFGSSFCVGIGLLVFAHVVFS